MRDEQFGTDVVTGPARDERGRFKGKGGRRGRPVVSRSGCGGRGRWSKKTHLELGRALVDLERRKARLLGELGRPIEPVSDENRRMDGIRALQAKSVDRRVRAMDAVLRTFDERRIVPTVRALAESMCLELGVERFAVSQLYRPPLDTMWRQPADWIDRCPGDNVTLSRHLRLPMRELHRRIVETRIAVADLHAELVDRLITGADMFPPLAIGN